MLASWASGSLRTSRRRRFWERWLWGTLLAIGLLYASAWLQAEWHYNAGWRPVVREAKFLLVGASPTPERALEHLALASRLFPFVRDYRSGVALFAVERSKSHRDVRAFKVQALNALRPATLTDNTHTTLLGHQLAIELDLGLIDEAELTFEQFRQSAKRGPAIKTGTPSPATND